MSAAGSVPTCSYPVPANEAERLRDLARLAILDTPPETQFTRLVELCADRFRTPICAMTLIDARRVYTKAHFGLSFLAGSGCFEMERGLTICSRTIMGSNVLVVPDAADPQYGFHESAFVVNSPCVRFYAGTPLVTRGSLNVGTLCVIDVVPREFSEEDRVLLAKYAQQVVHEMELRLVSLELERRRAEQEIATALAQKGLVPGLEPAEMAAAVAAALHGSTLLGASYVEVCIRDCDSLDGRWAARASEHAPELKDRLPELAQAAAEHAADPAPFDTFSSTPLALRFRRLGIVRGVVVPVHVHRRGGASSGRKRTASEMGHPPVALLAVYTARAEGADPQADPPCEPHVRPPLKDGPTSIGRRQLPWSPEKLRFFDSVGAILAAYCERAEGARELRRLVAVAERHAAVQAELAGRLQAAEREARRRAEAERRLLHALDVLDGEAVLLTDPAGLVAYANEGLAATTGWHASEVVGSRAADLLASGGRPAMGMVGPETSAAGVAALRAALESGGRHDGELLLYRKDGSCFWTSIVVTALRDADGELENFCLMLRDVTSKKEQEAELVRAKAAAESAAEAKTQFVSNCSHEIRTPLNGIVASCGLLLDERDSLLTHEQRDIAETIRQCSDTLLTLINDILDWSKLDARKVAIRPAPCDLWRTLSTSVEVLAPRAAPGIDLAFATGAGVPRHIVADDSRIRQVLINLLGNALKFTSAGHVMLRVSSRRPPAPGGGAGSGAPPAPLPPRPPPGPGERVLLQFEVEDTGVGIDEEAQQRLFEPFFQVDASFTRRHQGTGLGLSISRELAACMGGGIALRSGVGGGRGGTVSIERPRPQVGKGSTFTFTVEAEVGEASPEAGPDPAAAAAAALAGRRLLLVEGGAPNRAMGEAVARDLGLPCSSAGTLAAALELAARERPALALVCSRAAADEPAALAALRALGVPVAVAVPHGQRPPEGCAALPAAHRPVSHFKLAAAALSLLAGPTDEPAAPPAPSAPPPRLSVLLAEDNLVNVKVALKLLRILGCEVDVAADGVEAVAKAEAREFDVVLMDLMMPRLSGLDATVRILQSPRVRRKPAIVALTANVEREIVEQCKAVGMRQCVAKPFQKSDLAAVLSDVAAGRI